MEAEVPPPQQDEAPPAEDGLSAYERERLETIRQNNRVLVDLGLGPAPGMAGPSSRSNRTVAPRRSKAEPTAPGRASSRLAAAKSPGVVAEEPDGTVTIGSDVKRAKEWMMDHHFSGGSDAGGLALEAARDPLADFRAGYMPESVEDLLEGEVAAYDAVLEAVRHAVLEPSQHGLGGLGPRRRRAHGAIPTEGCYGLLVAGARVYPEAGN